MPLSYGSIAGNLSSCIQLLSAVFSTTVWFTHVRSPGLSGDALAAPVPGQHAVVIQSMSSRTKGAPSIRRTAAVHRRQPIDRPLGHEDSMDIPHRLQAVDEAVLGQMPA